MRIAIFILLIFLCSCNGGSIKSNALDSSKSTSKANAQEKSEKMMAAGKDFTMETIHLKKTILYGRLIRVPYNNLQSDNSALMKVVPGIVNGISHMNKVMKGPLQLLIHEIPEANKELSMFVGIPINNADKMPAEFIRVIEAGDYYKATFMSSPGAGAGYHQKILAYFRDNNLKSGLPLLEVYNSFQNESEVHELRRATFLYPIK